MLVAVGAFHRDQDGGIVAFGSEFVGQGSKRGGFAGLAGGVDHKIKAVVDKLADPGQALKGG